MTSYADVEERMERQRREAHERHMRDWLFDIEAFPEPGSCYFIENAEAGLIKIGASRQPHRRRRQLQRDTPDKLRLLATAPGGRERESYYHTLFRDHARGNEWFERCPEILAEINRLNAQTLSEVMNDKESG